MARKLGLPLEPCGLLGCARELLTMSTYTAADDRVYLFGLCMSLRECREGGIVAGAADCACV